MAAFEAKLLVVPQHGQHAPWLRSGEFPPTGGSKTQDGDQDGALSSLMGTICIMHSQFCVCNSCKGTPRQLYKTTDNNRYGHRSKGP